MIRLVTQFDSPKGPRGGLDTDLLRRLLLLLLLHRHAHRRNGPDALGHPVDVAPGPRRDPERIRWRSPWPAVLGALTAPLVLAVALFTWWTVIVPWGLWFLLVGLAYWGAGHARPWRRGALVATLGVVAFVVEFVAWAAILLSE